MIYNKTVKLLIMPDINKSSFLKQNTNTKNDENNSFIAKY